MSDWPLWTPPPPTISPTSWEAGAGPGAMGPANGNTTWPTTNMAIAYPIFLTSEFPLLFFWWVNGATVNGNTDVGVYTAEETPTKLASTGSKVNTGTHTCQSAAPSAAITLTPGMYYLVMVTDSATQTFYRSNNNTQQLLQAWGYFRQASANVPLPATLTPAAVNFSSYAPWFGIASVAIP